MRYLSDKSWRAEWRCFCSDMTHFTPARQLWWQDNQVWVKCPRCGREKRLLQRPHNNKAKAKIRTARPHEWDIVQNETPFHRDVWITGCTGYWRLRLLSVLSGRLPQVPQCQKHGLKEPVFATMRGSKSPITRFTVYYCPKCRHSSLTFEDYM